MGGQVWRLERFAPILDLWSRCCGLFHDGRTGHWSDEPVAAARQRLNEPRHIGRIPERIAQPAHRGIQPVFEIDECLRRPQSLPQLLPGDEFAGTIQQRLENLKRLLGQIDADAGLPQFARANVQLECAKTDERIQGSAHSGLWFVKP